MSFFYHVTPSVNVRSILETGIDVGHAQGKMSVIWLVNRKRLEWAILHVCDRHTVYVHEVVVMGVELEAKSVKKTAWPGVFYTIQGTIMPETVTPAMFFVGEYPTDTMPDLPF